MKIAILADSLDNQNAGVHIFTQSLVKELIYREDQNSYLLVRLKKDSTLPKSVTQIVIPTIKYPIGYSSVRLFYLIPRILKKYNVDVVFEPAHFGPFNLPKNVLRLTFIHDLTPIKFPQYHKWHSQVLQRIFLKKILTSTDHIFTNSQSTSADLEYFYPFTSNKNTAILLGKDKFYEKTVNKGELTELNITAPYFLTVGTIEPRKNHALLLEAFGHIAKKNREIQLVIAGGLGWKYEGFLKELESCIFKDQVVLLKYVEKRFLPILYSNAIALVYPSLYEGFGFPILEAMSCGAPVICSNTSSLPEVGGDLAFYFNPTSSQELQNQMAKVLELSDAERGRISERSIIWSNQFSWQGFATTFLNTIHKVSSERS